MEALQSSIRSPQLGKYFLDTYYVLNSAREMKITKKGSSLAFVVQLLSCVKLLDCSTSGFPVFHYFPEFAQTHVHGYLSLSLCFSLLREWNAYHGVGERKVKEQKTRPCSEELLGGRTN